jgi:hypothetical protein
MQRDNYYTYYYINFLITITFFYTTFLLYYNPFSYPLAC